MAAPPARAPTRRAVPPHAANHGFLSICAELGLSNRPVNASPTSLILD
ncbi:hypothetical protein ACFY1S_26220 [Micromonospora sp. NPDC000663]